MRLMVLAIPALAVVAAAAQPARARSAPDSPCGTMENTREMLDGLGRYFTSDWHAGMRGSYVRKVRPDEPRAVVADTAVCRAALDAALRRMRTDASKWREREARGYDHAVFRYGPYYAVLLVPRLDPPEERRHRPVPLLVFRASDMAFRAIWMA
jgi:hypothetical protein